MSTTTSHLSSGPDLSVCVLCGGPNDCAIATAKTDESVKGASSGSSPDVDEPCWCVGETFPATLLAEANTRDQGARCICQRCLLRAAEAGADD